MTAAGGATVQRCPNCGAPLELDVNGHCRWCGVPVLAVEVPRDLDDEDRALLAEMMGMSDDLSSRNPFRGEPNDIMLLQPVSNILIFLETTAMDGAVKKWLGAFPSKDALDPLVVAVRQAGTRIKLEAMQGKHYNEFAENSHLHTPEEWWEIGLALDILATIGSVPGIDPITGAEAVKQANGFRRDYSHQLKKARDKAGPDQAQFQALRAAIPTG